MKKNCRNVIALLLLSSALLVSSGCNETESERAAPPATSRHAEVQSANSADPKTPEEALSVVESLVAPIALYPDPLLAEVLIAATYPAEIAQAAHRLEIAPGQKTADSKSWDASLIRLAHLPSVIIMLNEHPQWTIALGDAFLAEPDALLQAIQTLRLRAMKSGFLKDSAAQKVLLNTIPANAEITASESTVRNDIITILPAEAEKIHVPLYDPQTVFSATLAAPPGSVANKAAAQPAAPDETNAAGSGSDYYPANYPVDSISGDSGSAHLAFGAATVVPGLLTWGQIEWKSGRGYSITHPYANLSNCNNAEECWMRSVDQGYYYANTTADNFAQDGKSESSAPNGQAAFGIPWHHDPRHRRTIHYGGNAVQKLGKVGLPPLAGQRLSGPPQALTERGFAAPLATDDAEVEIADRHYTMIAAYSVFSGISGTEAGDDEALQRGKASRNRHKTAVAENINGNIGDSRRKAPKPSPKQTVSPEALRALYIEQQRREAALPSVFDADYDAVRFVVRFSQRGAESRTNKMFTEAAKTPPNQTSEEGD